VRVDIYNKFYNPSGKVQADEFTFPYGDATFDFAFATSVFTHMMPAATAHYLKEIARVLIPGGYALITTFLWNSESEGLVAQGKSTIPFGQHSDLIVRDPLLPEAAVAIREAEWEASVNDAGLVYASEVLRGSWCGRARFISYQDVVVIRKPC
jgi:SAM-dependent methyltransferase